MGVGVRGCVRVGVRKVRGPPSLRGGKNPPAPEGLRGVSGVSVQLWLPLLLCFYVYMCCYFVVIGAPASCAAERF